MTTQQDSLVLQRDLDELRAKVSAIATSVMDIGHRVASIYERFEPVSNRVAALESAAGWEPGAQPPEPIPEPVPRIEFVGGGVAAEHEPVPIVVPPIPAEETPPTEETLRRLIFVTNNLNQKIDLLNFWLGRGPRPSRRERLGRWLVELGHRIQTFGAFPDTGSVFEAEELNLGSLE